MMQMSLVEDTRRASLEAGQAVVVNVKTDGELIEWAKARGIYTAVHRGTQFGNPYRIGLDGGRAEVIAKYAALLRRGDLLQRVGPLAGHALGCYCAPRACHADLLALAVNQ